MVAIKCIDMCDNWVAKTSVHAPPRADQQYHFASSGHIGHSTVVSTFRLYCLHTPDERCQMSCPMYVNTCACRCVCVCVHIPSDSVTRYVFPQLQTSSTSYPCHPHVVNVARQLASSAIIINLVGRHRVAFGTQAGGLRASHHPLGRFVQPELIGFRMSSD